MRRLSLLLAITGLTQIAAPLYAQEVSISKDTKGFYFTAGVGAAWAANPSLSAAQSGSVAGVNYSGVLTGTQNLGGSVAAEGGLGYDFGNNLRGEVTYVLNSFSVGSTTISGNYRLTGGFTGNIPITANVDASGTINTNSVFTSGYYDFRTKSKFTPYIGAGLGWTSVSAPMLPYSGTATVQNVATGFSGTSGASSASALGYIAKIGVAYAVAKPADIYFEGIYQGNTGVTISDVEFGALNSFGARFGVRYKFGI